MGGTSSSSQQQQSTTNPWAPAQGTLTGILGSLQGYLPMTGLNGNQDRALSAISQNGTDNSQFNPAIDNSTASLLAGGGALNQVPMVQAAYKQYGANTSPLANNTNYDPMQTPGIGDQLQSLKDQISTSVNGSFAAAGRDGSGYNQKALGQGLAAGLAPVLTGQYNQNVQNQQNAAGNLYNAGNTNAGILSGLQQQYVANQQAGVGQVGTGLDAKNSGSNTQLMAEAQRLGIPLSALSQIAGIGVPIAGLGGTSTGTAQGSNTMSGAQQFATIANGVGSLGKLFSPIKLFGS